MLWEVQRVVPVQQLCFSWLWTEGFLALGKAPVPPGPHPLLMRISCRCEAGKGGDSGKVCDGGTWRMGLSLAALAWFK